MPEYKTMRVPEDAWEAAKAYKEQNDLTWDQYLRLPVEDSSTSVQEQLDEIQRKVNQINSAQGDTVAKALEIGDSRNPVELDATEYSKIADEIVGRLR